MICIDSHSHSTFSDGNNSINEMVEAARRKGLNIMALTDHFQCPIVDRIVGFEKALTINNLKKYLRVIEAAKVIRGVKVLKGLEVEYISKAEEEITEIVKKANIDFALGCVHTLKGLAVDYTEEEFKKNMLSHGSMKGFYIGYYEQLSSAIRSGIFDSVAHLDLIKIFNKENKYFDEKEEEYVNAVEGCLDTIKKKSVCVELNTSGFDKPVGVQYPSKWIIERCFTAGIDLTIGSDAHNTKSLGNHRVEAEKLLKDVGFSRIAYFENRKKKYEEVK
ncbi:histidinol-phosphatase [Candidatus Woesearchaeota archaeon]|nr:histidinol-phosphatase [Candidatus Woesearchaeota archaeon]